MFSIRAKQRPIPSISAFDSSKFQFNIFLRSFRPDFLSVSHGVLPPYKPMVEGVNSRFIAISTIRSTIYPKFR